MAYGTVTGGALYCRKQPISGYAYWGRFDNGTRIEIYECGTSGWYETRWPAGGANIGYVMSQYVIPESGGSGGTGTPTNGKIQGTNVNVRAQPNTSATIKAVVNTGNAVVYYAGETYTGSGYTWYRCTSSLWSGDGYIAVNYVVADTGSGGTTGYSAYDRSKAASYALQYSSNTSGTASYNSGYRWVTDANGNVTNDCANFVSQCLYEAGMPMNPTWYYKTPYGTYTGRTTAWTGTVSLKNMLESRGWATRITDKYQLKKGDIVFTYESESSLPHVVIVCRDVSSDGNIYICGHTTNQRDVIRKASLNSIYYRIHDSFAMQSGDWR